MTQEKATDIVIRQPAGTTLPDEATLTRDFQLITRFQRLVQTQMIQNHDYGIIPGTNKPTLLKPGAEKIAKLLGLADEYEIVDKLEDWTKPFFRYLIRCRLTSVNNGCLISSGLGECNSLETKYRYRWVFQSTLPETVDKTKLVSREIKTRNGKARQYRLDNDEIFSQVNTILKMAKKRALVDAALSAGRLSDVFTQDIEDIPSIAGEAVEGETAQAEAPTSTNTAETAAPANPDGITEPQRKKLFAISKDKGIDPKAVTAYMQSVYGVASSSGLTKRQASELIEAIEQGSVAPAAEAKQPELTDGDFK
jgi:hypothetical protein